MPEGTDNKVRAEIQFDREFSSSTDNCIMVTRPTPSHLCDGYNSSGGNDSDDGLSYWDRNPRSGHSRGPIKRSTDMHGAQEGINTRTRNLGLYRQDTHANKSSQTGKQAQSLQYQVSSKRKPKKRSKSCKENDFEKEYWNEMKGELRPETLKFEFEEIENEKSMKNWKKRKPIEQSNNVEVWKDQHRKKIKENKELSEKGEEELEKFDRERDTFLDKDQNYVKTEYNEDNLGDCEMKKFRKDNFNEKMFAIENDQTAMLEKQNLKKIDALNPEKIDQEKEITNEQNKFEKEKMKVQQGLEIKKWRKAELEDRSKEELVVNMEQGRDGLKNADKLGLTLDNKALDSIREKLRDKEETGLKQFLDPQCDTQTEKQDVGKEISPLGQELYMADKESSLVGEPSSLGFEVEESLDETVDPESSVKFPNLEIANKLWEQSRREYNKCMSIDENSCSFSWERPTSIESLVCTSLAEKEQWEDRQSCPHLYGSVCYQDSNRLSYELTNILHSGQAQKEALSELNKKKIYETINTKSDKKDEFEDYEEKFKKEERDRKDKNLEVDENEKLVSAVEKTAADDDTADDADDKENVCKGDEHVDDDHHADLIDSTQKNEKESANNNGDGNDDFVGDDEIEEDSLEIIDAEEKDLDEKENTTTEDRFTANAQEKYEDDQIDANSANTSDNADVQEESEDALDTPVRLMVAYMSKEDDGKFGMAHCRLMFEDSKENKKRNKSSMVWKCGRMKKFCDEKPDIWEKKRIPKPTLPKQGDKLAPKKNWNGRRYSMFGPCEFGRKCSTNSGGRSGNGGRNNDSGSNSSSQRNNGDKNSKNRRNQNNKDRDDDDKNNINNNNPGHTNTKGTEPENVDPPESTRDLGDVCVPSPDFKGYRKKHTDLGNFGWLEIVGQANEENGGPVWDLFLRLTNGEHMCLSERLDHLEDLSDDALQCSICLTVDSLLKHYAHCLSVYNTCTMCVKIFSLICSHVADCLNNNSVSICEIRICKAVRVVVSGSSIGSQMKTLWFQVRKKLARISDDAEEDIVEPRSTHDGKKGRPYRVSGSSSGPLPSIPEGTPLSLTSTSRSGSRVLRRKKSNLTNVEETGQSGVSEEEGSSSSLAINAAAGAQGVEDEEQNTEEVDSKHGLYSRPEIPDEADAIPTSSEEGSVESTGSGNSDGSGQFGMMAGVSRFVSLPMGPPGHGEPYFPSFKDKPTGKKGIGEVVYAGKHQLVVVVTVWEKFKTQYLIEAKLARHYTEEGVILADFKSKLHIKGLRYQNEFQWVKIAHLGNGMTGKCHLAMDFETEFKFCVKEIHISNYEKEEIELWSELDHPNIVQVYGAIRHGEEIYILQEFIEGGCLTEAINIQRKLGRRLSQLAALRYFQQLVQVLKYLKTRNILHEDLKADNILLNKTSEGVSLKVADFGLARRCQGLQGLVRGGTKPVGTQTQWSPEKAEAVGYGFAAEIWAAVCVLVHMLSGLPPWVRRYESFKALIVVIVEKSPPLEDIPRNIHEPIKDLIRRGFTVCQGSRPTAEELLLHSAFRLLEEAPTLQSTSGTYSILESIHFESPTNRIDYDPNADLREIYRNLERESTAGATASNTNEGARRKERKVNSIVDVHGEDLPYYSNDYRVYAVGNGGRESKKAETPQPPAAQAADKSSGHQSQAENAVSVNIYKRSRKPSQPDDNIDPMTHIDRFYNDNSPTIPPQTQPKLVVYHPNLESIGSQKGNSSSREPSLENLSSGTVTEKLIPDFEKILQENIGDDIPDISDYRSDEEGKEDNILENFDFEEGVRHVRENYNLPTVVNTSTDLSSGTPLTSEQGIPSHGVSAEKNSDGQIIKNLVQDNANKINSEIVTKEAKSVLPTIYPVIGEDQLPSINDDDLFKSGSPPKFSPEMLLHPHSQGQFSTIQEIPEAFGPSLGQRNEMLLDGSGMVHQMITPGRQRLEGSSLPPLIQHVPTSKKVPGHPWTAPADTYMRQHHPDQQQDLLYLGQQGQQQMLTQNQQQYYLQQTQQRQDLSHTPNFVTGLGTAPRHYPSGQNTSVPSYQYHQHGQGQLNVHGGYSYANNFQGQRQMMHVQNPFPLRSEIQPEDLATSEHFNQHRYTNPYGLASMPNQYGKTQFTPVDHLSMYTPHFSPRQTSTPRSDGHHNGARPKVPQQPKQLFTGTEGHSFGRKSLAPPASVNLKINDPRKVYESVTGRVGQYPMYPVQPKTPILNPVINPRPVTPQEGQRVDLRLDIGRAQQAPDTSVLSHAQTAPVFSPPKTPKKSPDLHRTMSQVPMVHKSPSLVGVMSASSSTKDDRMSSSASKSQFEEQDDAYRELGRTAEEALSQHSDPASRIFFPDFDDDIDEEIKGEMHGLESYLENPAESLAHLLDPEQDCSITVTFRSSANAEEFSMKFSPKHTPKSWEKIIKEELDGFSRVSISDFGLQRFCLRRLDGSVIDLDSCLGNKSCTAMMVEASDNDPWWIEGGIIYQ